MPFAPSIPLYPIKSFNFYSSIFDCFRNNGPCIPLACLCLPGLAGESTVPRTCILLSMDSCPSHSHPFIAHFLIPPDYVHPPITFWKMDIPGSQQSSYSCECTIFISWKSWVQQGGGSLHYIYHQVAWVGRWWAEMGLKGGWGPWNSPDSAPSACPAQEENRRAPIPSCWKWKLIRGT